MDERLDLSRTAAFWDEFAEFELAPLYGALPFILWWGLDHDALWETQLGRDFADVVLALDTAMGRSGVFPCYFALMLARRATPDRR